MLKSLLQAIGFGNAKVDARLRTPSIMQGGTLEGDIYITGADSATNIDELYLKVITEYKRESGDNEYREKCILAQHKLFNRFTVQAREQKVIPFSLPIPFETPVTTIGWQKVYLQTTLETSAIFDPSDSDAIQVVPHPHTERVLSAIQNLGFQLFKVDCEYTPRYGGRFPFVQEFEFKAHGGEFYRRLDELEAYIRPNPAGAEVILQIDRRGGFFGEMFGTDESYASVNLSVADLQSPYLPSTLRNLIASRI